jgi:hypothetical protein
MVLDFHATDLKAPIRHEPSPDTLKATFRRGD